MTAEPFLQLGGRVCGRERDTMATVQAPNDANSSRWQRLHLKYFGFTFEQWEQVATCCPSFFTVTLRQFPELNYFVSERLFRLNHITVFSDLTI